jgi:hypothetical protein
MDQTKINITASLYFILDCYLSMPSVQLVVELYAQFKIKLVLSGGGLLNIGDPLRGP